MARAIDADAFMKEIRKWLGNETDFRSLQEIITGMPTIDPVKHGKWIENTVGCGNPFDPYKEDYMDVIICSECGTYYGIEDRANYCPNCGARMDGE